VKLSAQRSTGTNALWRYFGLTQRAQSPPVADDPLAAKLDLLLTEVKSLSGLDDMIHRAIPLPGVAQDAEALAAFISKLLDSGKIGTAEFAGLKVSVATANSPSMATKFPTDGHDVAGG
jgi:hypothetical protein